MAFAVWTVKYASQWTSCFKDHHAHSVQMSLKDVRQCFEWLVILDGN